MIKENVELLQTSFLLRGRTFSGGSFNITVLVQQIESTKRKKLVTWYYMYQIL